MLSDGNNPNNVKVEDEKKQHENKRPEQTAPFEHCECGTRTGGGRCGPCKDLIQSESASDR